MRKHLTMLCPLVVLMCIFIFSGCSGYSPTMHLEEPEGVEQVGQVPDEFQSIIENNIFKDITAFEGRLLKSETCSEDEENHTVTHRVRMMDVYGKELAVYECSSDDAYRVKTLTATEDGGFLFVLGFRDYSYGQNAWASDNGFASRVIKCDRSGNLQFDTPLDGIEETALRYCFEHAEILF